MLYSMDTEYTFRKEVIAVLRSVLNLTRDEEKWQRVY